MTKKAADNTFVKIEISLAAWQRMKVLSVGLGYSRAEITRLLIMHWIEEVESGNKAPGIASIDIEPSFA